MSGGVCVAGDDACLEGEERPGFDGGVSCVRAEQQVAKEEEEERGRRGGGEKGGEEGLIGCVNG